MKEKKQKYARYPNIFGKLDLRGLCQVARKNGMQIIEAVKPDMHVCNEIGLYGTPSAMHATDKAWIAAGHELRRKKSGLNFGVNLKTPRAEWVEWRIAEHN